MKKNITVVLLLISVGLCAQSVKNTPKDVASWQSVGKGNVMVSHGQVLMEEVEGSKGFMLLSPEKYTDVVFSYEVMTMNPATVLVAILNASDIGISKGLTLTEKSDNFSFWTKNVENYMFGFRVMAHNSTPFLRKHPAKAGETSQLALANKDVMHSGWRHKVECGKKGKYLWLKVDNEILLHVQDKNPLDAGRFAIRVRGTGSDLGKCMIRNLEVEGTPVK